MNKTLIIAEAGVNHNGNINTAKKLILAAKKSGADIVKFQYFTAEKLATEKLNLTPYQAKNTKFKNQFQMLKKLELSEKSFKQLSLFSKKKKIKFCLSLFDEDGVKILRKCQMEYVKVPSGEINNYPLLEELSKLKKKIILSTGMSNLKEIKKAIKILCQYRIDKKNISVLQCTSAYPAPFEDMNLNVINLFRKKLKLLVGLSDHSTGIEASIAAIPLGAKIIEKHLTLNKKSKGPDHKASLNPKEFEQLVNSIRNIEKSLGNKKLLTNSEKANRKFIRKKIFAKSNIYKNDKFSFKNLTLKRTNSINGKDPIKIYSLIGKKSKKKYAKDQIL